jgi:hypothetical protein
VPGLARERPEVDALGVPRVVRVELHVKTVHLEGGAML